MAKTVEEMMKEISTGEHPSKIKLDIYRQVSNHLKECKYCQERLDAIERGFDADKYPEDTLSTLDPCISHPCETLGCTSYAEYRPDMVAYLCKGCYSRKLELRGK